MVPEDSKILRIVYTFFLGLLLAIFVGVGINTFYEGPKAPEYPPALLKQAEEPSEERQRSEDEFQERYRDYEAASKPYNRNVSIIALSSAVLFVVASFLFERRIRVIADGVMLGGLFTLFYSIIRSVMSEDTKYVFITVTIGLVLVLYLGYHRFVRSQASAASTAKKK